MRTKRNISRSIDVHGKELNRVFFAYVFECDQQSRKERKVLFKKHNKIWLQYCFRHKKHKIIPPSPDGLKMLIKDIEATNKIQAILGIKATKPFGFVRAIFWIKKIFHL